MARTPALVPALLAVHRVGPRTIQVDHRYPAERIRFMLNDCAATVVMSDSESLDALPDLGNRELFLADAAATRAGDAVLRTQPRRMTSRT